MVHLRPHRVEFARSDPPDAGLCLPRLSRRGRLRQRLLLLLQAGAIPGVAANSKLDGNGVEGPVTRIHRPSKVTRFPEVGSMYDQIIVVRKCFHRSKINSVQYYTKELFSSGLLQ